MTLSPLSKFILRRVGLLVLALIVSSFVIFISLNLASGGHLSHGMKLNTSAVFYKPAHYELDPATETIDFNSVRALAKELKPRMILCGYSAYPRTIDFARFRQIADETGALMIRAGTGTLMQNPLVTIASRAASDMIKFAGEFGLTPRARTALAGGFIARTMPSKFAGLLAE